MFNGKTALDLFTMGRDFVIKPIIDLIFPKACLICGQECEDFLCEKCRKNIIFISPPICGICGRHITESKCTCMESKNIITSTSIATLYTNEIQTILHRIKYNSERFLMPILIELMVSYTKQVRFLHTIDIIMPVPMHSMDRFRRGFNQSEDLAEAVAKAIKKPLLTGILIKHKHTKHQANSSAEQRLKNPLGAFTVTNTLAVEGRKVLLIDDVVTTRTTINECAKALLDAGAAEVYAYILTSSA